MRLLRNLFLRMSGTREFGGFDFLGKTELQRRFFRRYCLVIGLPSPFILRQNQPFPHKNKNEIFPVKTLRNLFLRMATPKNASFTELIFADHEFYTHFCGINFCVFGANPQK